MRIRKKSFGFELGVVLLILSIPISQIIKLVFGFLSLNISQLLLILSLFLICNKTNLIRFRFPSMNKMYLLILVFQIYTIILAIYSNIGFFTPNSGIIYILFTILLILLISTNKRRIDYELIIKLFIYISGTCNVLLLYFLTNRFSSLVPNAITEFSVGGVLVADRLTLSTMVFFYIIALLVFRSNNKVDKLINSIFLFVALLNILATSRRGLMVALIVITFVHLTYKIRQNKLSETNILKSVKVLCLCFFSLGVLFLIVRTIPELSGQVNDYISRFTASLVTFFRGGNESSFDSASYARVLARENAFTLLSRASLTEIVFGFGYMHQWIDFPFMQAIIDMGIICGIIYVYIQLKPVIYVIFKKQLLQDGELFFFYLTLVGVLNNFYSGIPYGYYKYVYLIPFIYVVLSERRVIGK